VPGRRRKAAFAEPVTRHGETSSVAARWYRHLEEVREQLLALDGENRLRVELHRFDGEASVAQPHDFAVIVGPCRDDEIVGHGFALDDERVIAGGDEALADAPKESAPVVQDT